MPLCLLERLGVFSQEKIKGLVDIFAKDVKRHDLVKKVKNYRKTSPRAVKCTAKKERGSLNEKRKQLEETFEMHTVVTQFDALGQHLSLLQRALNNGEASEATESVRRMVTVVQDMGSKLNDVNKRLSPDSSNSSDGDSMLSSGDDTSLRQDMPMGHVSKITKPVPKQRRHVPMQESATSGDEEQSPAPLECEDNGSFTYVPAITLKKTPILPRRVTTSGEMEQRRAPLECEVKSPSPYDQAKPSKKQPMFPKRTGATGNSRLLETKHEMHESHENDGKEDKRRDSGMETGSETGPYSSVEIWKQAMKHPPPDSEHIYQKLSLDSREPDSEYQNLRRKSK